MAEFVLGIDLGTSNSVVAAERPDGPEVLVDAEGRGPQPSIVSFHPSGSILVGHEAKRRRLIDAENTIYSAKRLIGRPFSSPEVQKFAKRMPYPMVAGDNDQTIIEVRDQRLSVPEVSAFVLHHMKIIAERTLRQTVSKVVITVPANFNDAQRSATMAAGEIAGLEVLRIINEPTAAALAYGHGKKMDRKVLVYDFGGGTFDVTILEIHGDVFEVLATAGDTYLGGDDFDVLVVDRMAAQFLEKTRYDVRQNEAAMERLLSVAEQVKCQLSTQGRSVVQVQEIAYGPDGATLDLDFAMHRDEFEDLAADLVDRTFAICDEAFALAQIPINEIDEVALVGGSTRMPLVRESVRSYFARAPLATINPDEVVALGAAIQGASLLAAVAPPPSLPSAGAPGATVPGVGVPMPPIPLAPGETRPPPPPKSRPLLLDVTPMSLGVAIVGGYAKVIIPRNAQVPAEQTEVFSPGADDQTSVSFRICQGESQRFEENTELGELILAGLRPAVRGDVRIEVTFEIDTNGILKVHAKDETTGRMQDATIKLRGELGEHEMSEAFERIGPGSGT
jgi:molecular chaperone DnaK